MDAVLKIYLFALVKRLLKILLALGVINKLTHIKIRKKLLRLGEITFKVDEIGGLDMILNTIDVGVSHSLILKGTYERDEVNIFKKMIRKGSTFVDVGANIGFYTLLAANLVGRNGKVFAFEPDPYNFSLLKKNILINGFSNVHCYNQAVADRNGILNLSLSFDLLGDHNSIPDPDREIINVKKVSLDSVLKNNPVDIVKIDIQGTEELAVRGLKETVSRNKKIVIMTEFCPELIKKSGLEPKNLARLIDKMGLVAYIIKDANLVALKGTEEVLKEAENAWSINIFLKLQ